MQLKGHYFVSPTKNFVCHSLIVIMMLSNKLGLKAKNLAKSFIDKLNNEEEQHTFLGFIFVDKYLFRVKKERRIKVWLLNWFWKLVFKNKNIDSLNLPDLTFMSYVHHIYQFINLYAKTRNTTKMTRFFLLVSLIIILVKLNLLITDFC